MAKHSTILRINNGMIENETSWEKMLAAMGDGRWLIEADNSKKRTNQQNRYLHAVLIPEFKKALLSVGYDQVKNDEQAKLIMKTMFLVRQITNETTGEVLEFVQDTHNLSTLEMTVLIEEVIKFAAENLSYVIPYPNEQMEVFND